MKKSYEDYIIYALLGLVILLFIFTVAGFPRLTESTNKWANKEVGKKTHISNNQAYPENVFESISTGSTDSGDVSVELTPYKLENGQLKVKIAANTHSVDLSKFDLKQITTLEYNGKSAKPLSASDLSGHHANGELVFEVDGAVNSFTIKIEGIPKIELRVFKW